MPPSLRLALRELTVRRGRTALMVAAIAISTALVVAVSSSVESVQATVERSIVRFLGSTDARVVHQFNGRFDAEVLDAVRRWPGVESAAGRLFASVSLEPRGGGADLESGDPFRSSPTAIGIEPALEREMRHFEMRSGRWLEGPHEVLLDPLAAEQLGVGPGDVVLVQWTGPPVELTVAGVYERRVLGFLQNPQARLDRTTLAAITGMRGRLNAISIRLEEGVDVETFCANREPELPEMLALEPAELLRTGYDRQVEASRVGLVISSMLAFLAASFIIVTGMTTGVIERQRELAVMRCVGARRGQLVRGQLAIGAVLGAVGAAGGIPLGLALSAALVRHFHELLPAGFHPGAMGMGLGAGGAVGAGLIGAVYPAYLAGGVPPLEAMARRAKPVRRRAIAACAVAALACIGVQLALLVPSDPDLRFWLFAWGGLPALGVGYFLLAVPVVALLARVAAAPLSRLLGLPRDMLGASVRAAPFRHGFTAGALMVGLAILVSERSGLDSLLDDWIGRMRFADGFATRLTGIDPAQQAAIAALPFVERTCAIGYLPVRVIGRQVFGLRRLSPPYVVCVGFDPESFLEINELSWRQGDEAGALPRLADGSGVLVADRFLAARGLGVGDRITLCADRVQHEYEIVGVVSSAGLDVATELFGIRSAYSEFALSCVFMDAEVFRRHYDNDDAIFVQVDLADWIDDEEATERILASVPGVAFYSGRWIRRTLDEIGNAMKVVQATVAFSALVLASLAVGNVIVAGVQGRRFEFGVLRAVGGSRTQLLRLILAEAALLAVAAIVVGSALGMHLSQARTVLFRDLLGLELPARLPFGAAAAGAAVLFALALAAALPGAWLVIRPRPAALVAAGGNE